MGNKNPSNFKDDYLQNLLKGNRNKCSEISHQYLAQNASIENLYEEVFKLALYEVGHLWETNQITVATEHLATAITESILNELFEQIISNKRFNKKVVMACVENEHHQVGIKMVADIFEMKGWETFFLGTGIPTKELIRFIKEINPDMLAISLSVYFNYANLLRMIESVRAEFPYLKFIIGGQALTRISDEAKQKLGDAMIISDLYLLEKYIDALNNSSN